MGGRDHAGCYEAIFRPSSARRRASKHAIKMRLGVMVPSRNQKLRGNRASVRSLIGYFFWTLSKVWTFHESDPITQHE